MHARNVTDDYYVPVYILDTILIVIRFGIIVSNCIVKLIVNTPQLACNISKAEQTQKYQISAPKAQKDE